MGRQYKGEGMVGRKDQVDFNLDRRYGNPSKKFRKRQQRELGKKEEKRIRDMYSGGQQDFTNKYTGTDAYKVN